MHGLVRDVDCWGDGGRADRWGGVRWAMVAGESSVLVLQSVRYMQVWTDVQIRSPAGRELDLQSVGGVADGFAGGTVSSGVIPDEPGAFGIFRGSCGAAGCGGGGRLRGGWEQWGSSSSGSGEFGGSDGEPANGGRGGRWSGRLGKRERLNSGGECEQELEEIFGSER